MELSSLVVTPVSATMSNCFRCEISTATVQCEDCGNKDPEPVIYCDECSALMHIGKMARHSVVPMMFMKMKCAKQKDFAKYNQKYKGVEQRLEELELLEKNVQELLRVHERNIRQRVVELQDKLKQQAVMLMNELKAANKLKVDKITEVRQTLVAELEAMKECSEKINSVLSLDDGDFSKDVQNDSSIINQPWTEPDLSALDLPIMYLGYSVDFGAVAKEIEGLKISIEDEKPVEFELEAPKFCTGEELPILICSSLQKNGTFNVSAEHSSSVLVTLHSLSTEIRLQMIRNVDWRTYSMMNELPSVGDKVLAKHPLDKKWYRAQIREQTKGCQSDFLVLLLDYGNMLTVSSAGLVPYKDLAPGCPSQAFVCTLFPSLDIHVPIDPIWMFHDLTHRFNKLFCHIKERLQDTDIWEVELFGQNGPEEEKVSISGQILSKIAEQKEQSTFSCRDFRYRDGMEATGAVDGGDDERGRKKNIKKKKNKRGEKVHRHSDRGDGSDHNVHMEGRSHSVPTSGLDVPTEKKNGQTQEQSAGGTVTEIADKQNQGCLKLECSQTPVKPEGMSAEDFLKLSPSLASIPFSGQEGMSWADIMEMQQKLSPGIVSPDLLPNISPQKELVPCAADKPLSISEPVDKISDTVRDRQDDVTVSTANGESREAPTSGNNGETNDGAMVVQEKIADLGKNDKSGNGELPNGNVPDGPSENDFDLKAVSDLQDEDIAVLHASENVNPSENYARSTQDVMKEASRVMQAHYECEVTTAAMMGAEENEHYVEHNLRDTMEDLLSEVIQCVTEASQQRSGFMQVTLKTSEEVEAAKCTSEAVESLQTAQQESEVTVANNPRSEVMEVAEERSDPVEKISGEGPEGTECVVSCISEDTEQRSCDPQDPEVIQQRSEFMEFSGDRSQLPELMEIAQPHTNIPEEVVDERKVETPVASASGSQEGTPDLISDLPGDSTSGLRDSNTSCEVSLTENVEEFLASQHESVNKEDTDIPSTQTDQVLSSRSATLSESKEDQAILPETYNSAEPTQETPDFDETPATQGDLEEGAGVMISPPTVEDVTEFATHRNSIQQISVNTQATDIKAYVPPSPDRTDDDVLPWSQATAYVPPPPPPDQSPCSPPAAMATSHLLLGDEGGRKDVQQQREAPSNPRTAVPPLMRLVTSPPRGSSSRDSDGSEDMRKRNSTYPSDQGAKEKPRVAGKNSPKVSTSDHHTDSPVEVKAKSASDQQQAAPKAKSLMDYLPRQNFYEGARFQARVTSDISESGMFWLQLARVDPQEEEAYKSLETQLQEYSRLASVVSDPVLGQLVFTEHKGKWYRARLQKTTAARAQVCLVDAGRDVSVPLSALRGLETFCQLPEQAKSCCMATNEYNIFSDAARKLFSRMTKDKTLSVLVLHLMSGLPYVAMFDCTDPKQPPFNIYAHIVESVPSDFVQQPAQQPQQIYPVNMAQVPMVTLPVTFNVPPPSLPGNGSMSAGQPSYNPELAIAQLLNLMSPSPVLQQEVLELFHPRGPDESLESFQLRQQKQSTVTMLQSQVWAMSQGGGGGGPYVAQDGQGPGNYQQMPAVSHQLEGPEDVSGAIFSQGRSQSQESHQSEPPLPQQSKLNHAAEEWRPRQSSYRSQEDSRPNEPRYSDRSHHQGHHSDRQQGDRHKGDRHQGDRPHGSRSYGDRPYGDRPPQHQGREPWSSAPHRQNSPVSKEGPSRDSRYIKGGDHREPPNCESPGRPSYSASHDSPSRHVEQESWNLDQPPRASTENLHQETTSAEQMEAVDNEGSTNRILPSGADSGASDPSVPKHGKDLEPFDEDAWVEGETVVEQSLCQPTRTDLPYSNSEPQHRRYGRPNDSRPSRGRPNPATCYICRMEGHRRNDCPKRQPQRRDRH